MFIWEAEKDRWGTDIKGVRPGGRKREGGKETQIGKKLSASAKARVEASDGSPV